MVVGKGHVQNPLLEVTIRSYGYLLISLPLFSFLSCIFISLVLHFESVTRTDCNVSSHPLFTVGEFC